MSNYKIILLPHWMLTESLHLGNKIHANVAFISISGEGHAVLNTIYLPISEPIDQVNMNHV